MDPSELKIKSGSYFVFIFGSKYLFLFLGQRSEGHYPAGSIFTGAPFLGESKIGCVAKGRKWNYIGSSSV